jgi:hypothetical protein
VNHVNINFFNRIISNYHSKKVREKYTFFFNFQSERNSTEEVMADERQQRVRRSLRDMENSANELASFLDGERNRRKTIEIVVGQGAVNF